MLLLTDILWDKSPILSWNGFCCTHTLLKCSPVVSDQFHQMSNSVEHMNLMETTTNGIFLLSFGSPFRAVILFSAIIISLLWLSVYYKMRISEQIKSVLFTCCQSSLSIENGQWLFRNGVRFLSISSKNKFYNHIYLIIISLITNYFSQRPTSMTDKKVPPLCSLIKQHVLWNCFSLLIKFIIGYHHV